MNSEIYFDNSATTAPCEEAKAAVREVMEEAFANPSSLHAAGLRAEKVLNRARTEVLSALGAPPDSRCLVFCGSGSEANNLALIGSYTAKKRRGRPRVILTEGEHASIEASAAYLETLGADVVRLSTTGGEIRFDELSAALTEDTVLISSMLVNNETGAVYPVERMFAAAKAFRPDILCHCDAVQGFLKIKFSPASLGADLITVSAHKIHGPKGAAALYISAEALKRRAICPIIHGGQQENGLRAGTENMPGIAGFGAAAQTGALHFDENRIRMETIRNHICQCLKNTPALQEIWINEPKCAAPHILSLTLPDIKSETMLNFLSGKHICVSSGSACSSHTKKISRSLTSFGKSSREADCTIRVSLSHENTTDEADALCSALAEGLSTLVRIK